MFYKHTILKRVNSWMIKEQKNNEDKFKELEIQIRTLSGLINRYAEFCESQIIPGLNSAIAHIMNIEQQEKIKTDPETIEQIKKQIKENTNE